MEIRLLQIDAFADDQREQPSETAFYVAQLPEGATAREDAPADHLRWFTPAEQLIP